jgi:hypothetical protein
MTDLLKQLSEKVWVIQGRTNTGIIKLNEGQCLVVDPGQDRESAKTVYFKIKLLFTNSRSWGDIRPYGLQE